MKRNGPENADAMPPADPLKDAPKVLDRKVRVARAVILFERVWRALLWPFAVAGSFLILTFADVWGLLPTLVHQGALVAFGAAFIASLVPVARVAVPDREEGLRRLEKVSGIKHRPATSFEDEIGENASEEQRALWLLHRKRLADTFAQLTAGWPHPRLAKTDPYALRAALLLLLLVGFVASGEQTWQRIAGAFSMKPGNTIARFRIDAWVTPPLYTAKPPVILADGSDSQSIRQLTTPEKSLLLIRLNGPSVTRPGVRVRGAEDTLSKTVEPSSSEDAFSEYKVTITEPAAVIVGTAGLDHTTWHFDVIKDTAPLIDLIEEPNRAPRGGIRFAFRVQDDYGVAGADAKFRLPPDATETEKDKAEQEGANSLLRTFEPPDFPLTLPRANAKVAEGRAFKDLTAHPWAGLKVIMTLAARDQAGQEGKSQDIEMVLPARKFTKPMAKALVEQRRNIVRRPDERRMAAKALKALTIGADKFLEDKTLYLGIMSTYWRLRHDKTPEGLKSVVSQLWDLALRVEDGDLSRAEVDLRAAQEELRKALEDGASEQEISRLIDKLRNALNRFLQAMAEKARQNGNLAKMPEGLGPEQLLSNKDLEEMLRKIESLAKTGSREMAQRMLDQLANMMQRLQMGQANPNSQSQQMMNMVQGLGEVIKRQQKLLDETFKEQRKGEGGDQQEGRGESRDGMQQDGGLGQREYGQRGQQGRQGQQGQGQKGQDRLGQGEGQEQGRGQGKGNRRYGGLSNRQGAIRDRLDGLLEQLRTLGAKPPDQLEGAGQAMREAEKALDDENLGRAVQQQTLALDRLRQGTQSVAEQMLQSMASRMGQGGQRNKDPFGRPERTQGPDLGTSVKVPDEIDIQRAREILEELRRRLSEPTRPMLELDYLERLIQQF
jgi:uncharacterized protein (TIGR02302 family)